MRHQLASVLIVGLSICSVASATEAPEVSIKGSRLRVYDEVSYTPHSVVIEHPASDVHLGETLGKLPGVVVNSYYGMGGLTTAITPQALGSGATGVSIDDIPIINPTGNGINFSLFPNMLIDSVEQHSPFYPSMDPSSDTLPAPGGRINLKTLRPPREGESRVRSSVMAGTGNSAEGSLGYRGGDRDRDWVVGLGGFGTQGNFPYVNPTTGAKEERQNNDSAGGGGLLKHRWNYKGGGTLEILDLGSYLERTNPGGITAPGREHETDTFNLLGLRYNDRGALSEKDGLFGKLALAYSRTETSGTVSRIPGGSDKTDTRTVGNYAQAGYSRRDETTSITLAFDNEYDYLSSDSGVFNRDVFGSTATLSVDVGKFRFVPLVRQEASSKFTSAGDASLSAIFMPDANQDLTLSYGLQHLYPSITAASGFSNSGTTVLPNPDLKVERDSIVSLSYTRRDRRYTLYSNAFYDLVRDRSTFVSLNKQGTLAQFVNVADVSVWGYTLDGQVFPTDDLSLRGSVIVSRAWDRVTNRDLTFKPRFTTYASAGYLLLPWLGFTVEEQFISKRYISTRDDSTLAPYGQTNLRLDANVWQGVAFVKVANLFDAGGFVTTGFPHPGRTYWVGYSLGQRGL